MKKNIIYISTALFSIFSLIFVKEPVANILRNSFDSIKSTTTNYFNLYEAKSKLIDLLPKNNSYNYDFKIIYTDENKNNFISVTYTDLEFSNHLLFFKLSSDGKSQLLLSRNSEDSNFEIKKLNFKKQNIFCLEITENSNGGYFTFELFKYINQFDFKQVYRTNEVFYHGFLTNEDQDIHVVSNNSVYELLEFNNTITLKLKNINKSATSDFIELSYKNSNNKIIAYLNGKQVRFNKKSKDDNNLYSKNEIKLKINEFIFVNNISEDKLPIRLFIDDTTLDFIDGQRSLIRPKKSGKSKITLNDYENWYHISILISD